VNNSKSSLAALSLFMVICIDGMGWGIVFPLFNPIFLGNSIGIFHAGTSLATRNFWFISMIALYSCFMFFGSPLLGALSDQYGRKKILLISMGGSALGFLLCVPGIYEANLFLIILGRIISGITSGSMAVAQAAMVDISTEKELPSRLGLIGAANAIGFSIGPVVGGFFLDTHLFPHPHYGLPFLFCALLFMGITLFTQLAFKETFVPKHHHKINWLEGFHQLKIAFTLTKTRHLFIIFSLFLFAHSIFFSCVPLLLTVRFHQTPADVGYFLTYFSTLFSLTLIFITPKIIAKFDLKKTVFGGFVVQLLGYFIMTFIYPISLLWVVTLLLALAIPSIYVGMVSLISQQADKEHQGRIMGVTASIMAITWTAGPLLASTTVRISYIAPFWLATILIIGILGIVQKK
jgi:DHA1 family tetracycline resistance protein-like MFS transporter